MCRNLPQSMLRLMLLVLGASWLPMANAAKLAVNVSYDDALPSQLENAVPALQQHQIPASFYLVPDNPGFKDYAVQWQKVAAMGHELGNHTFTHPCRSSLSNREWVTPDKDLDLISADDMRLQVEQTNIVLKQLDGRDRRSFTPPCGDQLAKGENYWSMIDQDVSYIKGFGLPAGVEVVWAPVEMSGQQLIDFITRQPDSVKIVTLIFHGVGGDYLSVSNEAHQALLAFLAAHRDDYYLDTYQNVRDWYENQ